MSHRSRRLGWIAFPVILAAGWSCGVLAPTRPAVDRVILITIDTLRADHLSAYGYVRATSPFFDELAEQGVLFENTVAPIASTVPSHASLFTSLCPLQHGVLKNGHRLSRSHVTLAELFRDRGYLTAGVVSTLGQFGAGQLDQGFAYFDEPSEADVAHGIRYRSAATVIERAIEWLETIHGQERFLLWIHLFDPHLPLRPPSDHYDLLRAAADGQGLESYWLETQHVDGDFFRDRDNMLHRITEYDAEIRYVDQELRRLFAYCEHRGIHDRCVWVITSDHGEGCGNHAWWGHGKHIYNEQLRIPLLFHFPSREDPGRRVEDLVATVDIGPTLLELAGDDPARLPERQGFSLQPLFHSGRIPRTDVFSQRRVFEGPPPRGVPPEKANYETGAKYALQTLRHKYIHRTDGGDEFYDLIGDPYETENRIGTASAERDRMREALLDRVASLEASAPGETLRVDERTRRQLESLGYTH